MSYPLLRISEDNSHVEVRKGRGAQRWEEMEEIFNGAARKGQEWEGGEGDKLSARRCKWPKDDPCKDLSIAYWVNGLPGVGTGKPRLRVFPARPGA